MAKRVRCDFIWIEEIGAFVATKLGTNETYTHYWDADICAGPDKRIIDLKGRSTNIPSFADETAESAKTLKPDRTPDKAVRVKGWCTIPV